MAKRSKVVNRSAKTGRFVKKATAKRHPKTTVTEKLAVSTHSVEMARSATTGRFVKKATAKRHPDKTIVATVKRESHNSSILNRHG